MTQNKIKNSHQTNWNNILDKYLDKKEQNFSDLEQIMKSS
jgi:hypothetical protein